MEGLINKMKNIHRDPSLSPQGLAPGTAKKNPSKSHIPGGLLPGHGRMRSGHQSPAGTLTSSSLLHKHPASAILVFLAALAFGLLFLLPGGLLQAQSTEQFFSYPEKGTDPVATFSASDPEGAVPIVWSLAADDFDDSDADIAEADSADGSRFKISSDGVLSFRTSPNYEMPRGQARDTTTNTNTYRLVVQASDGDKVDRFKVIVTVTNVDEPGKVTWTVDPDADGSIVIISGGLLQFRTGAQLFATVTDPDSATPTVTRGSGTGRRACRRQERR